MLSLKDGVDLVGPAGTSRARLRVSTGVSAMIPLHIKQTTVFLVCRSFIDALNRRALKTMGVLFGLHASRKSGLRRDGNLDNGLELLPDPGDNTLEGLVRDRKASVLERLLIEPFQSPNHLGLQDRIAGYKP